MKKILLHLPEYLLIAAVIFYWVSAGTLINPIAMVLFMSLVLQIIFKNRIIGIIIPVILILASFYMLLALMSELSEFPTFDSDARKLLFVGLSYFISTIIISGVMLYRYLALGEIPGDKVPENA